MSWEIDDRDYDSHEYEDWDYDDHNNDFSDDDSCDGSDLEGGEEDDVKARAEGREFEPVSVGGEEDEQDEDEGSEEYGTDAEPNIEAAVAPPPLHPLSPATFPSISPPVFANVPFLPLIGLSSSSWLGQREREGRRGPGDGSSKDIGQRSFRSGHGAATTASRRNRRRKRWLFR